MRAVGAGVAYVAVVAVLLLASTRSDRYPVPEVGMALAAFGPPLGCGLWGRSWWLMALVPLPAAIGYGLLFVASNPWLPLIYGAGLSAAALLLILPGVAIGRRTGERVAIAGVIAMAAGLLVIPGAVLERGRTVTVERASPLAFDERRGTFRGAGLGDTLAGVRRRLGEGERVLPNDTRLRGVGPSVTTGPSFLAAGGEELRYGRDVAFLLDRGRVNFVTVADRRARTRAGVGPGDSLERFRDAYPAMRCSEGSVGSDEEIPFPECTVRIAEDRWLYVGGTYDLPGEPAVVLIVSPRRVI